MFKKYEIPPDILVNLPLNISKGFSDLPSNANDTCILIMGRLHPCYGEITSRMGLARQDYTAFRREAWREE